MSSKFSATEDLGLSPMPTKILREVNLMKLKSNLMAPSKAKKQELPSKRILLSAFFSVSKTNSEVASKNLLNSLRKVESQSELSLETVSKPPRKLLSMLVSSLKLSATLKECA